MRIVYTILGLFCFLFFKNWLIPGDSGFLDLVFGSVTYFLGICIVLFTIKENTFRNLNKFTTMREINKLEERISERIISIDTETLGKLGKFFIEYPNQFHLNSLYKVIVKKEPHFSYVLLSEGVTYQKLGLIELVLSNNYSNVDLQLAKQIVATKNKELIDLFVKKGIKTVETEYNKSNS